MAEASNPQTLTFHGQRMSWVSPTTLDELVQLKMSNPKAPLVIGNTSVGKQPACCTMTKVRRAEGETDSGLDNEVVSALRHDLCFVCNIGVLSQNPDFYVRILNFSQQNDSVFDDNIMVVQNKDTLKETSGPRSWTSKRVKPWS